MPIKTCHICNGEKFINLDRHLSSKEHKLSVELIELITVKKENIQEDIIQNQINTSKKLIDYYSDKKNIFYMFSFKYFEELYVKYGIVGELRNFKERVKEHMREFKDICFHNIIQCEHVTKIESDFKNTLFVITNKVKIQKKYGGYHTEIIKLNELVTINIIKEEMIKIAAKNVLKIN